MIYLANLSASPIHLDAAQQCGQHPNYGALGFHGWFDGFTLLFSQRLGVKIKIMAITAMMDLHTVNLPSFEFSIRRRRTGIAAMIWYYDI